MTTAPVTLVLLPGMDGSGALFAGFAAALGEGIAPLVLSYPSELPLDYQGLVDFASARLPAGQPYVLLGESFSGPVAIALAAMRPPGLAGLILSCTFARNPVPQLRHFSALIPAFPISSKFTGLIKPLLLGAYALPALRSALDQVRPAVLRARARARACGRCWRSIIRRRRAVLRSRCCICRRCKTVSCHAVVRAIWRRCCRG